MTTRPGSNKSALPTVRPRGKLYIWWCPDCRRQLIDQGISHICERGEVSYKVGYLEVVPKEES